MSNQYTECNYKGKPLAESAASVTGGTTGAIIGSFIPGGTIPGAIVGTVLGEIVNKGLEDFLNRFLSHRKQLRINSAVIMQSLKLKHSLIQEIHRETMDSSSKMKQNAPMLMKFLKVSF
ncbi:MAG: hypothetical protein AAGF83_09265 [Cyanobacteria bacterium P01_G01_bin.67]